MYLPPFVSAVAPHREYPLTSPYPMRWAWVRPVEDVRRAPRKGKWITEEEEYTQKLIECFNKGFLNISQGTTLRSCLSEKLNCDPMRITKKFAGSSCIGKQVYQPCEKTPATSEEMKKAQQELMALEQKFHAKIEHLSRPTRYPYVMYGPEPVAIAPDTAPAEMLHAIHDYPHPFRHAHAHPYLTYPGVPSQRTFFPYHEHAKEGTQQKAKAEVSPHNPSKSPASDVEIDEQASAESLPNSRSKPDIEGGGLLLSFFKSVQEKEQPKGEKQQDEHQSEEHKEETQDQEAEEAADEVRKETRATTQRNGDLSPASPDKSADNAPKRSATVSDGSSASTKKRRVPESFASQAGYRRPLAHGPLSFPHGRTALPSAGRLALDHRLPIPPVPPLDFQALHAYAYPTMRSYPAEYEYPAAQHYLTDPLRRIPYPVYDDAQHAYRAVHAPHAVHAHYPLAAYSPYTVAAHTDVGEARLPAASAAQPES